MKSDDIAHGTAMETTTTTYTPARMSCSRRMVDTDRNEPFLRVERRYRNDGAYPNLNPGTWEKLAFLSSSLSHISEVTPGTHIYSTSQISATVTISETLRERILG